MKLLIELGFRFFFLSSFIFPLPRFVSLFPVPRLSNIHCLCWDCTGLAAPEFWIIVSAPGCPSQSFPLNNLLISKQLFDDDLFRYAVFPFNCSPGSRQRHRYPNGVATTSCGKDIWKKWKVGLRPSDETSTTHILLLHVYFLYETSTWHLDSRPPEGTWYGVILRVLRVLGQGLKSECADILHQSFLCCCAILTSPKKGETAVYGYNPALFWVLLVSCWCLAELNFRQYDQHCSILLAEFNMSTIIGADPGKGSEGPGPLLSQGLDNRSPPYLKVWIRYWLWIVENMAGVIWKQFYVCESQ